MSMKARKSMGWNARSIRAFFAGMSLAAPRSSPGRGSRMSSTVGKWYWHIHHDVLAERSTEPIGNRRKYIRENKPGREHETRLRLLKPVKSPKVGRAWAECKKARDIALAEYEKIQGPAPAEYVRAHDSASAEYRNVLVAIH